MTFFEQAEVEFLRVKHMLMMLSLIFMYFENQDFLKVKISEAHLAEEDIAVSSTSNLTFAPIQCLRNICSSHWRFVCVNNNICNSCCQI